MDLKTLKRAIDQIADEKGIDPKKILDAIESSIAAAYKKEYEKKGEIIRTKFDLKTGALKFWQVKTVVDENTVRLADEPQIDADINADKRGLDKSGNQIASEPHPRESAEADSEEPLLPRYNPDRHILLSEAKEIKKNATLGEELEFPLETREEFGRIAAQTAKQVILQKLRDAERESVLEEFKNRSGEIVSGVVQRFDRGNVTVELGRATGILFSSEGIPGEHYKPGDRMKFYVLAIQEESRIPGIILSRAHPKFVSQLFALEVPEIADGSVEIKAIAREPGNRTKIAVHSTSEGVDPVGACVGQRGTRVMAVSNELGQEKVDIIEWSEDPSKFIASALSPAEVRRVEVLDRREARVFIDENQLSLAIGKGGQNVRLAARLTGWKIDVRSTAKPEEVQAEGVAEETIAENSKSDSTSDKDE